MLSDPVKPLTPARLAISRMASPISIDPTPLAKYPYPDLSSHCLKPSRLITLARICGLISSSKGISPHGATQPLAISR
jgi:hypothetical protein